MACSGAGLCIAESGECECFDGFTGDACQRRISTCGVGGKCSGHGQCLPMHHGARAKEALPLSEGMSSYGDDHTVREHTGVWDWNTMMGCACDSSSVRPASDEYQLGERLRRGLLQEAVPDWLRAVWKSNFGRPTTSCVCSMAWGFQAIDAPLGSAVTASARWRGG